MWLPRGKLQTKIPRGTCRHKHSLQGNRDFSVACARVRPCRQQLFGRSPISLWCSDNGGELFCACVHSSSHLRGAWMTSRASASHDRGRCAHGSAGSRAGPRRAVRQRARRIRSLLPGVSCSGIFGSLAGCLWCARERLIARCDVVRGERALTKSNVPPFLAPAFFARFVEIVAPGKLPAQK
jgi:hypothetical protein